MLNIFKKRKSPDRALEGMVYVRGGRSLVDNAVYTSRVGQRQIREVWTPRALDRQMLASRISGGLPGGFTHGTGNRGEFYRYIRDSIPIISAGVEAWVRLCSTPLVREIEGSAANRQRAEDLLAQLDSRILEAPYGRGSGLARLTTAYFLELFTTGRFAGEAVLSGDKKSVNHFRYVDPFRVGWQATNEGWKPFVDGGEKREVNGGEFHETGDNTETEAFLEPHLFFYGTLGSDITNPLGREPLACIPFVAEIEQMMLEDMARSSHNAGTPRLQIKIRRPERFDWEGDREYIERSNRYFGDYVSQFGLLEADDNVFTWDDVEVTVVGGAGRTWEWRLNREQVVEDVVTGLKLFPWVLGRTHKTTQNWVQSQYDMLMQVVQSHQNSGADLADWLSNLELRLQGVDAVVRHRFDHHPDPFRLERAQAERAEFDRIDLMVQRGYISRAEAARRLGLAEVFVEDKTETNGE